MRYIEDVKGFLGDFRQGLGGRRWRNATPCQVECREVLFPVS
jgi:hypothetical protein